MFIFVLNKTICSSATATEDNMSKDINTILAEVDVLNAQLSTQRPLPPEVRAKIQNAWNIENTYESNRIEGNTLTLQETALVVNEGLTISGKSMREHLEAVNHAEALAYIQDIAKDDVPIDERTIKDIHAIILRGIDRKNAGVYRSVPVMISGSRHMPPQPYFVEPQMEQFMTTFKDKEAAGNHPVLTAAYLHDELVRIHPFIDGNGRTARLLMNLYLLKRGYLPVTLKGTAEAKLEYYTALEQSHVDKSPQAFQCLVAEAEAAAQRSYLALLTD